MIELKSQGNVFLSLDPLWIATRNEESRPCADGWYILPIPPFQCSAMNLNLYIRFNQASDRNLNRSYVHYKTEYFQTLANVKRENSFRGIVLPRKSLMLTFDGHNALSNGVDVSQFVVCKWWIVPTINNVPCPGTFPHMVKKLRLSINNQILHEGDGPTHSHIVPLLFQARRLHKYLIYEVILQNTPCIFPYDTEYMSTDVGTFSHATMYSGLNASRIDCISWSLEWDLDALAPYKTQNIQLHFFSESFNIIQLWDAMIGLRFCT